MRLYATLFGLLILLSASATEAKAEQRQVASVPVYSTGYVTIHTIPEGALILVNTDPGTYLPLKYLASGYSPLRFPVDLADGVAGATQPIF
jgi:hypothetical protein